MSASPGFINNFSINVQVYNPIDSMNQEPEGIEVSNDPSRGCETQTNGIQVLYYAEHD